MTSLAQHKYIAFKNGELLADITLEWIIDAALRGKMTPSGEKLLLIPDTRIGPADTSGLRHIGKFRKSDCLTLKQLMRKMGRSRIRQKGRKTAKKKEVNQCIKNRKIQSGPTPLDCRFLHKEPGADDSKNASIQVSS